CLVSTGRHSKRFTQRARPGSRAASSSGRSGGLARAKRSAIFASHVVAELIATRGAVMSLADKFNLFNEFNILRITCAIFFIPHIVGKITVPATLDFFVKAGFRPAATWMYIAGAIETVLCIGLFFGIYL